VIGIDSCGLSPVQVASRGQDRASMLSKAWHLLLNFWMSAM